MAEELADAAEEAASAIAHLVQRTPCVRSEWLSRELRADVWLKLENRQATGSFKVRGAANKLRRLDSPQLARGVVTSSTGNHGLAVAHVAAALGTRVEVWVPEGVRPAKVAALEQRGTRVVVHGVDAVEAEMAARADAERTGRCYVSPYNDPDVIAGQGTLAIEMVEDLRSPLDVIFVSVGGGGLVAGVAAVMKRRWPQLVCIGCSPANSPVMARSVAAGQIVSVPVQPTLSDATAGGIEPGAITFELCRALVNEWVLVDEVLIGRAAEAFQSYHAERIEGAAAVAVASALQRPAAGARVAILICGGNAD